MSYGKIRQHFGSDAIFAPAFFAVFARIIPIAIITIIIS